MTTLAHAYHWVPGVWCGEPLIDPIFRHCWECMLEVTPSRRCVVRRQGDEVLLAPILPDALERLCLLVRNKGAA